MAKQRLSKAPVVVEYRTGIKEASGLAPLPGGDFLIVDDERGVFRVSPGLPAKRLESGRELGDLEGICFDPVTEQVWVVAEADGSVWTFRNQPQAQGPAVCLGQLPALSKRKNLGWEGIALVPAGVWGEAAHLLAVHQAKPRVIVMLDPETLTVQLTFRLPKKARKVLGPLSDLAVEPVSGRLVVLSGRAGRLALLKRSENELEWVAGYKILTHDNDVPEGLAFDAEGRLWAVSDGKGRLRQLALP